MYIYLYVVYKYNRHISLYIYIYIYILHARKPLFSVRRVEPRSRPRPTADEAERISSLAAQRCCEAESTAGALRGIRVEERCFGA